MKHFFSTFGAALLAFFVGGILMWVVVVFSLAGMAASMMPKQKTAKAPSGETVLVIDLQNGIVDSPDNKFGGFSLSGKFSIPMSNTTLEVGNALKSAAVDPKIKGVYLNFTGNGMLSYANVEELRDMLAEFKKSGKFVVAYNDVYSQASYWLCSVADKVFVNPEGAVDWRGISANVMFFKGLLDKLGVDMEIVRHGSFKAAVEPYMTDRMSSANRMQMNTIVYSLWNVLLGDVADSRGISADDLKAYAENMEIRDTEDALRLGMVDGLLYSDQVEGVLWAMSNGRQVSDYSDMDDSHVVDKISLGDYIAVNNMMTSYNSYDMSADNKIAIIYAEGEIVDGESLGSGQVGGLTLSEQIASARKDDKVKAVVLRVNSPGGSALASEVIWREMSLCREIKPVIVSMGGMAASGGYYISSPADMILADRTTQTGSIGVFGMIPNVGKALEDKLGITFDGVKTGNAADMGSILRPMTPRERAIVQESVDEVYGTFVDHVAEGRNMTAENVDAIGQGRVWLGFNAMHNGLIDGFGGLDDAIAMAADRAGIAGDYTVYEIVSEPDPFMMLLSMFAGSGKSQAQTSAVEANAEKLFDSCRALMQAAEKGGVMARAAYDIEFY